ncbi:MAG TPA: hypothetical protein VLQ80_30575 [Candidatus Saccharimonadia bacterium]|nr:hypothetical protein [Candidatus Saccharimonadia bacterium]
MAARKTFTHYPFSEIPDDGTPLNDEALYSSLDPLLFALYQVMSLIAEGKQDDPEMHPVLTLMSGLCGLSHELLERWHTTTHERT